MKIDLKPEHEQFVHQQLAIGRYNTIDELLGAAFNLLSQQDQNLEQLRQQIAVGTEQIQQGNVINGEIVFEQLQERINQSQLGT